MAKWHRYTATLVFGYIQEQKKCFRWNTDNLWCIHGNLFFLSRISWDYPFNFFLYFNFFKDPRDLKVVRKFIEVAFWKCSHWNKRLECSIKVTFCHFQEAVAGIKKTILETEVRATSSLVLSFFYINFLLQIWIYKERIRMQNVLGPDLTEWC